MKNILIASLAGGALLLSTAAFADVTSEVANAHTHATLAAKNGTVDGVHMHLHHALNCLVGPNGAGFDAAQMNPCAKAGNGAIPDSTSATQKATLQKAVEEAQSGLAATDLATAQKDATQVAATIASAK